MQNITLPISHNAATVSQDQIQRQIFIGGCSRSGTTLLGAMIGAHPDVICSPESQFKSDLLRTIWPNSDDLDKQAVLTHLTKHWRYKLWNLPQSATALAQMTPHNSYASILNTLTLAYAQNLGKTAVTHWIDHTPENISYAHTYLKIFPNAKFIHIVRDGRAVAASIMPLDWGPNSIIKAARWWMRMTSFGLAAEASLPSDQMMQVKYEDLVLNPEETMRQVSQFLAIEYDEDMLNATGFTPPTYTTRQHQLVGLRPNPEMANRWRNRLKPREIEIFENLSRDFLQYLNYEMLYGLNAKGPSFAEIQRGKAKELFRGELSNKIKWLIRSYPLWLSRDFYSFAKLSDSNN